ncbi:hypothetical protein Cni_G11413 [Canna indica]|uniref:Uncharacterized protein n=1 Tax=Canna indica TaxID=4628 RepID=A0AAQ3K6K8_9LILI|nr:hypothetical protein Cni_G11413 [Canna indica]
MTKSSFLRSVTTPALDPIVFGPATAHGGRLPLLRLLQWIPAGRLSIPTSYSKKSK